ncbi:amidohydrolase 2 [Curvularia clavata]|uniref:Amidohydrolase 2 n=1 Tax=Curvularia clavata TaxID=95742 RepID=A0A9Q8Z6X5_CURCL|nr:amidohydrolase 2 [Curvularia clavata]
MGWHVDVGTHVLWFYAAGLFDQFPKRKIIIGHNGEGLHMFIDRIDAAELRNDTTFSRMWNTNIWIMTSGFFTFRNFEQLRQVSSIERIMYSVDYLFASTTTGWDFVTNLLRVHILSKNEMNVFAYKNAKVLLTL